MVTLNVHKYTETHGVERLLHRWVCRWAQSPGKTNRHTTQQLNHYHGWLDSIPVQAEVAFPQSTHRESICSSLPPHIHRARGNSDTASHVTTESRTNS